MTVYTHPSRTDFTNNSCIKQSFRCCRNFLSGNKHSCFYTKKWNITIYGFM